MMGFLKAYPFITVEEYYWKYTIPQILIMTQDAPREIYLTDKQAKKYKGKRYVPKKPDNYYTDANLDEFDRELGL